MSNATVALMALRPSVGAEGPVKLVMVRRSAGCRRCNGLTRLAVDTQNGRTRVGYLRSTYPDGVSDDPEQHPDTVHYQVRWHAETITGDPVEAPPAVVTPYFLAAHLAGLARAGAITSSRAPTQST